MDTYIKQGNQNGPQDITVFLCIHIAIDKIQLLSLAHTITPLPPQGNLFTTLTSANPSSTQHDTRGLRLRGRLDILPHVLNVVGGDLRQRHTVNYLATALVGIPAVRMPIASSLKTRDICCIVFCDKPNCFQWHLIVPSTRCPCVIIMQFTQLVEMPHQSSVCIIQAKEKCSLTGM